MPRTLWKFIGRLIGAGHSRRADEVEPEVVTTRISGVVGRLVGAASGLLAGGFCLWLSLGHVRFSWSLLIFLVVFLAVLAAVASTVQVRTFVFDKQSRTFTVEERWLVAIRGRRATHPFNEIRYIHVETGGEGGSDAMIELVSGKRFYPYSGSDPRGFCWKIAAMTGYGTDPFRKSGKHGDPGEKEPPPQPSP